MLSAKQLAEWDDRLIDLMSDYTREVIRKQAETTQEVVRCTQEFWLVEDDDNPILLFGFWEIGTLITRTAYIWVIPLVGLTAAHVRACRRLFDLWAMDYEKVVAHVYDEKSARFAQFFGLAQRAPTVFERNG